MRFTVNLDLIAEQYDQLVRILASLRDRTAPADVVLQRLINAAPADRLDKALTALGGLDKTIHILRYIHDMPLRQAIHLQLNRGALAMAESRTCISVAITTQRVIRVRCGATLFRSGHKNRDCDAVPQDAPEQGPAGRNVGHGWIRVGLDGDRQDALDGTRKHLLTRVAGIAEGRSRTRNAIRG